MSLLKYIIFISFVSLYSVINANSLKLTQVVILSRHNIRAPLQANLNSYTRKKSPSWAVPAGYLTAKGYRMEGYMGEYFFAWMNKEGLLPHGCPPEDTVYIYANTKERTKDTARSFATSAFRYCNITVHYKNATEIDPIFNVVLHNTTEEFKNITLEGISRKLNENDFRDGYLELENILDYKTSENCIKRNLCSLADDNNYISLEEGKEVFVSALHIGYSIVDTFAMSYYEGLPLQDIGWGKITKPEQLELLMRIINIKQDVRLNMTHVAKDFGLPLLNYMTNIFLNKNQTPFVLLVGHDANLNTVTAALKFKSFNLLGQYENFPIGGKVVFQKWSDVSGDNYLKVEYVYQKSEDIRNGVRPTLDNPPQRAVLELTECKTDDNDLCPWSDFVNILKEFA